MWLLQGYVESTLGLLRGSVKVTLWLLYGCVRLSDISLVALGAISLILLCWVIYYWPRWRCITGYVGAISLHVGAVSLVTLMLYHWLRWVTLVMYHWLRSVEPLKHLLPQFFNTIQNNC